MSEVRLHIDLVAADGTAARRSWEISYLGEVIARHETLAAALAAAVYQAEVELRRLRGVPFAIVSMPLPAGGRSEMYCAPSRARVPVLLLAEAQGAVATRGGSDTT